MKKYIFITPLLDGMGGAQMYLYSKYKTLQEQGWDVSVVHASKRLSILPIFKDLNDAIQEIGFAVHFYSCSKVEKVLDKIISRYVSLKYDEIIIESTCIAQCTWGEALAHKIKAKHICYLLQEENIINKSYVDFFLFKQKRGELAGIKQIAIERMFSSFCPLKDGEAKKLIAYGCDNTVENVYYPFIEDIERLRTDYKIASIGRLDKPFVIPMLKSIKDYIIAHNSKTFCVIMLGGSTQKKDTKQIEDIFKGISNCKLMITGYLFPLPRKVFGLIDLFISSAGSASLSSREGAITISYDANDYKPIGIMGHTTKNSMFRADNEPALELSTLLDDVLIEHKYTRKEAVSCSPPDYSSHFELINSSDQSLEYFDVSKIKIESIRRKIMSIIIRFFGPKFYVCLSEKKNFIHYYIESIFRKGAF